MTDGRPQAVPFTVARHCPAELQRSSDGGFRITWSTGGGLRLRPESGGWRVEGPAELDGWHLARIGPPEAGFVLRTGDGEIEGGRTLPLSGFGYEANLYYLLLGDGRLFRIAPRSPREGGFELLGWETPGPYWIARPGGDGWTLEPTPASGGLPEIHALTILFAAEILEFEEPLNG